MSHTRAPLNTPTHPAACSRLPPLPEQRQAAIQTHTRDIWFQNVHKQAINTIGKKIVISVRMFTDSKSKTWNKVLRASFRSFVYMGDDDGVRLVCLHGSHYNERKPISITC